MHYCLIIFIGTKMARIIFMGVDVSKEALGISINGKHKRIANVSDAISKFIETNIVDLPIKLYVNWWL
ncbi:hypothetical protein WUni_008700 [Wolbachia endosymbiont of Muscidifurax uniraptor]|nr:hypothetical protein WUni_008700 [Wolbachia endosymbiont of Muscidifurax uniraptor]